MNDDIIKTAPRERVLGFMASLCLVETKHEHAAEGYLLELLAHVCFVPKTDVLPS